MSDRITYDSQAIEEIGKTTCPDIANFYDDIGSKAAEAGRGRGSAFGEHALAGTWNDLFGFFYDVVYETGSNTRAMGTTLIQIAEDQQILEGELVGAFGHMESEIDRHGHTTSASPHYGQAPPAAPDPDEKDTNPYTVELGGASAAPA